MARDSSCGAKVTNLTLTDSYVHGLEEPWWGWTVLDILSHKLPSLREVVLLLPDTWIIVHGEETIYYFDVFLDDLHGCYDNP